MIIVEKIIEKVIEELIIIGKLKYMYVNNIVCVF